MSKAMLKLNGIEGVFLGHEITFSFKNLEILEEFLYSLQRWQYFGSFFSQNPHITDLCSWL